MGAMEFVINVSIMMMLINAVLFIVVPNSNPGAIACLQALDNQFNQQGTNGRTLFGLVNKTAVGTCNFTFLSPNTNNAAESSTGLPNQLLSLLYAIPILGAIGQNVVSILAMFVTALALIFNVLFLGWYGIYSTFFISWGATTVIAKIFFLLGSLLTLVQLFGIIAYVGDFLFKLRGAL